MITGVSNDCPVLDGIGVAEQQPRTGATMKTIEAIRAILKCFKVYMGLDSTSIFFLT